MADHPKERQYPLILIAAGILLYLLGALIHAGTAGILPTFTAVIELGVLQTVLLVVAAIIVATVLKIGFGDVGSAALKFAGAALFCGAISSVIPMGWLVADVVFLGLVAWLFEIEITYAIVLAFVYFLVASGAVMLLRH